MVKIKKTLILVFLLIPVVSHAAMFSYTISSSQIKINDPFTINFYVNSDGKSINAASANLIYDKNFFEVNSLSKDNTIISLWPDELKLSKVSGVVSFEGLILPPGFTGSSGKIFSLNITPIKAGDTKINITNASILLNNGTGGNVLDSVSPIEISIMEEGGDIKIKDNQPAQPEKKYIKDSTDFSLDSISHPNSNIWYKNSSPAFSWSQNKEATSVRIGISENENEMPTTVYSPPIFNKVFYGLSDGIYFFSVQNEINGDWGSIYKKVVKIDSTPPEPFEPKIVFDDGLNSYKIYFETTDKISQNLRYEIKIDNSDFSSVDIATESNPYIFKDAGPGKHYLYLSVYDEAGNVREVQKQFENNNIVVSKNNDNKIFDWNLSAVILIDVVILTLIILYLFKIIRDRKRKVRKLIKTVCDSYDILKDDIVVVLEKDNANIEEIKDLMSNIKSEMIEAKSIICDEYKELNK